MQLVLLIFLCFYRLGQKKKKEQNQEKPKETKRMLKAHERNDRFRFSSKSQEAEKSRAEERREESVLLCTDASSFLQPQNNTVTSAAQKCPHSILTQRARTQAAFILPFLLNNKTPHPLSDLGQLSPAPLLTLKLRKLFCEC